MPNPNYNQTITIYNRYKKDGKETWKKTSLDNCFFKCETNTSFAQQATKINTYTVRIPLNADYVEPRIFAVNGEGFTLQEGDLCILGNCDEVITGTSGHTATEVVKRYKPNSFKITSVSVNTAFIGAHYRIGG